MQKFTKILQNATKDISLKEGARIRMREHLVAYMEYHPLPAKKSTSLRSSVQVSRFMWPLHAFRLQHISGALVIAIVSMSGMASVSFAASDALPGDLLYSVKVRVNEGVEGALTLSDEAQAEFAQTRAERRLDEVSTLASQGRLDAPKKEEVTRLLSEHTAVALEKIRSVETTDPVRSTELSGDLENTLKTRSATLARIVVDEKTQGDGASRALLQTVQNAAFSAHDARAEGEKKLDLAVATSSSQDASSSESEVGGETNNASTTLAATSSEELNVYTPDSAKIESTDIRERAVYRAQKRAHEFGALAQEALQGVEKETPLYANVSLQVASIQDLVQQGDLLIVQHATWNEAYTLHNKAIAQAQALVQSLESTRGMLAEPSVTTVPVVVSAQSNPSLEEATTTEDVATTTEKKYSEIHAQVEALGTQIDQEQESLVKEQILSVLKEAQASILQAELAKEAKQYTETTTLIAKARLLVEEAQRLLKEVAASSATKPTTGTEGQTEQATTSPQILLHTTKGSLETYEGTTTVSDPCDSVEASGTRSEDGVVHIALITKTLQKKDETCAVATTSKAFSVVVEAGHVAGVSLSLDGKVQEVVVR